MRFVRSGTSACLLHPSPSSPSCLTSSFSVSTRATTLPASVHSTTPRHALHRPQDSLTRNDIVSGRCA